jgi:ferritin-like metal-binding protein YciE
MDSEQLRAHLAQAERHVAECRGHIARQRQVVEQLSLKDESREEAVVMLTILEDSLRILEQHRACAASRCKFIARAKSRYSELSCLSQTSSVKPTILS